MRTIAFRIAGTAAMACALIGIAQAHDQSQRVWPSQGMRSQPQLPPCTCRAMGREYLIGESICLRNGANARRAICGMDLNVTTWSMTDEFCETSARMTPASVH